MRLRPKTLPLASGDSAPPHPLGTIPQTPRRRSSVHRLTRGTHSYLAVSPPHKVILPAVNPLHPCHPAAHHSWSYDHPSALAVLGSAPPWEPSAPHGICSQRSIHYIQFSPPRTTPVPPDRRCLCSAPTRVLPPSSGRVPFSVHKTT
jgi:hypothetical protein